MGPDRKTPPWTHLQFKYQKVFGFSFDYFRLLCPTSSWDPLIQHHNIGQTQGTVYKKNKSHRIYIDRNIAILVMDRLITAQTLGIVSRCWKCESWGSMTTKRDGSNPVHDRLSGLRPKHVPELHGTEQRYDSYTTWNIWSTWRNMAFLNWNWAS